MKKSTRIMFGMAAAAAMFAACNTSQTVEEQEEALPLSGLIPEEFCDTIEGQPVALYTLKNANGMEVCITNYGGRIVSIMVPDKDGGMQDVVIGYKNLKDYTTYGSDFGASVGRYANRINQAQMTINDTTYQLARNNGPHCLHGGCSLDASKVEFSGKEEGFLGWQYLPYEVVEANDTCLVLKMESADMEAGFPGHVTAYTTYTLTADNAIDILWNGTTDKPTVLNQTNHCYFNLNGHNADESNSESLIPITNHILMIDADYYTPADETYMTTGAIEKVEGTAFDFRQPIAIHEMIQQNLLPVEGEMKQGFDHNWCLNTKGDDTQVCAKLKSPLTGIVLEVYTNEPGVQFYSGNFLTGLPGKGGLTMGFHTGMCLESQKYPDSPNKYGKVLGWDESEIMNPFLYPGEDYHSHCVYKFSVEK